jgi:hypothetical protein
LALGAGPVRAAVRGAGGFSGAFCLSVARLRTGRSAGSLAEREELLELVGGRGAGRRRPRGIAERVEVVEPEPEGRWDGVGRSPERGGTEGLRWCAAGVEVAAGAGGRRDCVERERGRRVGCTCGIAVAGVPVDEKEEMRRLRR